MAPRREKIYYGNQTGSCPVCAIALWDSTDNEPAIWPCNVAGCPYEKPEEQNRSDFDLFSYMGSGLAQIQS